MRAWTKPLTLAAAIVSLAAGCLTEPEQYADSPQTTWSLSGTLAEDVTAQDREDLAATVRSFDGDLAQEEDGAGFTAYGLTQPRCESLREKLSTLAYVEGVDACVEREDDAGGPGA